MAIDFEDTFKNIGLKSVISHYIPGEEEAFGLWAFGETYKNNTDPVQFFDLWNQLHREKLELKPNGIITEDIPLMIAIWRQETNKEGIPQSCL